MTYGCPDRRARLFSRLRAAVLKRSYRAATKGARLDKFYVGSALDVPIKRLLPR
jgi:hypothetical protein